MTTTTQIGMSLDELMQRIVNGERFELVDGDVLETMLTLAEHNEVSHNLWKLLDRYAMARNTHLVYHEATFIHPEAKQRNWVKGSLTPDIIVYATERMATYKQQNPDWRLYPYALTPNLVAEVISPNDSYSEVTRKVQVYLREGVGLVWLVNLATQQVVAHTPGSKLQETLEADDTLTGGDVLAGFSVRVGDLFPT